MKKVRNLLSFFLILVLLTTPILAKEETGHNVDAPVLNGVRQGNTLNQTLVNVGQVAMWIYSNGKSAITPGGCSGLIFPRGSSPATGAIFEDGPIWGGIVNDGAEPALRVGGGTYSEGTVAGAILSRGVAEDFSDLTNVDRVWRVRRDFLTANLQQDAAEVFGTSASSVTAAQIQQLRDIYRQDWVDWPAHKGAPFYDADSNGVYEPQFNSDGSPKLHPEADEPGTADADQVVWIVTNDLDDGSVQTLYGSPSIGMEVQTTLWAYSRSDALGQIIFKQFRFIYKGTSLTPPGATIDSLHFCQWSDPDLGSFGDDFAGSDTTLSLMYAYNSSSSDATYSAAGLPPPASGYDFFAGPLVPDPSGEAIFGLEKRSGFRNLPMTSAAFFASGTVDTDPVRGGDYNGTLQWWNLLRGFRPIPENPPDPWRDPQGNITKFRVPGDPVTGSGWIDNNPGDRRILLVSGPFTMALGDTQESVVAVMAALGSDRLSSVSVLKFTDRFAQDAFDNLFELAKAPPKPSVSASEFDGQILLNWAGDADAVSGTENTVDKGYAFEGYNVYQLPSAGANLDQGIKLATFDAVNEVTVISQEVFEQSSGLILNLPVQLGSNSGINRTFVASNDVIRDLNLVNGQTYFFGVTAYNFNADATVKTLESVPTIVTVVPQGTKPGVRLSSSVGDTLTTEHASGVSDGSVTPLVVDPSAAIDASYEVAFSQEDDGQGGLNFFWSLTNTTTGEELLIDQTNQSGDANYLITDGIQVVVAGPALQGADWDFDGDRWITGAPSDAGGSPGGLVFGGAYLGNQFLGSSIAPADFRDTHWEWVARSGETDLNGNGQYDTGEPYTLTAGDGHQKASLYTTWGADNYEGFFDVPWSVFDSEVDPPRQLHCIVRDRDSNLQWDMDKLYDPADADFVDVNGGDLQFNYIFVQSDDYDPTGAIYDPTTGGEDFMATALNGTQNTLWVGYFGNRSRELGLAPFTLDLIAPNVNTPDDVFSFTSSGPSSSQALAQQDAAEMVNVFPNPYMGVNSFEGTRFTRFITFSHLPQQATVRIFNLAGIQVAVLEKNDDAQFMNWDLQNENGLPVAGGIYVAHVEMPGIGVTKDLKLVIVQEQQFLRNF